MESDWTKHLWWCLWLIIPMIVWKFKCLAMYLIDKSGKMVQFKSLKNKNQIKVQLKTMRVVCFGCAFIIAVTALVILFVHTDYSIDKHEDDLPYFADKALKVGLILVSTVYILDITYYRQYMAWYNWSHHSISIIVFVMVYDYSIWFIISRLYCCIFGALLTSRWILHYASLYYYLGDKNKTEIRICLYLTGLIFHICFAFGQLIIGIIFKFISDGMNMGRFIFWIVFEIAVLPSQLHTFYDIYCIIRVKIYKAAFSDKIKKYSIGDCIEDAARNNTEINATTSPSLKIQWNVLHPSLPKMEHMHVIQAFDGYNYVKTGKYDVEIDSNSASVHVTLYGRIYQVSMDDDNTFFNNDKVAEILLMDVHPKQNKSVQLIAVYNDKKYEVIVTVTTDGIIGCKLVRNYNIDIPTEMKENDVLYIDLDGISYDLDNASPQQEVIMDAIHGSVDFTNNVNVGEDLEIVSRN